jgi:hypothetical protein
VDFMKSCWDKLKHVHRVFRYFCLIDILWNKVRTAWRELLTFQDFNNCQCWGLTHSWRPIKDPQVTLNYSKTLMMGDKLHIGIKKPRSRTQWLEYWLGCEWCRCGSTACEWSYSLPNQREKWKSGAGVFKDWSCSGLCMSCTMFKIEMIEQYG